MRTVKTQLIRFLSTGWLTMLLLAGVMAWLFPGKDSPIVVAGSFSLLTITVEGLVWARVATKAPDSLPTFFTAVSGFRMLLALITLGICCFIVGRDMMAPYVAVFMVFYAVQLIHHAVSFALLSKSKQK